MDFSSNLKNLRKEYGFTAKDLATKLNLTTNMVYEWEHGRCSPSIEVLIELSKIFNITIGQLVGIEDDFGNVNVQNNLTREEQRLLNAFKKLNDVAREKLIEDAEFYAGNVGAGSGDVNVIKK